MKFLAPGIFAVFTAFLAGCGSASENLENKTQSPTTTIPVTTPEAKSSATSSRPNLQSEILDNRFKTTNSPLAQVDFKNYSYPLPHGWQNPDSS